MTGFAANNAAITANVWRRTSDICIYIQPNVVPGKLCTAAALGTALNQRLCATGEERFFLPTPLAVFGPFRSLKDLANGLADGLALSSGLEPVSRPGSAGTLANNWPLTLISLSRWRVSGDSPAGSRTYEW